MCVYVTKLFYTSILKKKITVVFLKKKLFSVVFLLTIDTLKGMK